MLWLETEKSPRPSITARRQVLIKTFFAFSFIRTSLFLPVSIFFFLLFLPIFYPHSANLSLRSAYLFFLHNHILLLPCPPKRRVHRRQILPRLPKLRRELCEARPVSARLFCDSPARLDESFLRLNQGFSERKNSSS